MLHLVLTYDSFCISQIRTAKILGSVLDLPSLMKQNKTRWEIEGENITRHFVEGVQSRKPEELVLKRYFKY